MRYSKSPSAGEVSSAASLRRRPGQIVTLGFLATIAVGTLLLSLPIATEGERATFVEALFTATSATCVTGLIVTDTPVFWSGFGEGVIAVLIQIGGLGVMTLASLLGILLTRKLDLSSRLVAAASTRSVGLGDVRGVLTRVIKIAIVVEVVCAAILVTRFLTTYDMPLGTAVWQGVFHAVSAYNNAGFSLFSDSLMGFVGDPWVSLPISFAVILGGIGLPVIAEVMRAIRARRRPRRWSTHSRITLWMTGILLGGATLFFLVVEWSNPATMGPLGVGDKILSAFTQAVMPRTAGFNSLDTSQMNHETWLATMILMFVGAGSAGTAGGIKVTTFAVLAVVIWSELRGETDANVFDRRLALGTQRQALTVALLGVAIIIVPTLWITATTPRISVAEILFEVTSAFTTTGLSTGITADLPWFNQLVLVPLMFIGRLGPITLGTALALRSRQRLYRMPESAPIIG